MATPALPSQPTFPNTPQRFPKTQQRAQQLVAGIHEVIKRGPRSLVAQVADSRYHVSQGYCTCSTEQGVVPVYGIPYGSVIAGMRIFCRQIGGHRTNRAFVFDGYAPNSSLLGPASGSLLVSGPALASGTAWATTTLSTGLPSVSGLSTSAGYYWHLFYYLPTLPQATCTLMQCVLSTSSTTTLTLEMLPTGLLRFRSSDGHGYQLTSPQPSTPHQIHWVCLQPGLGSSLEFLIDEQVGLYTGITSGGDQPTWAGNGANYSWSFLSSADGTAGCPQGSWVSKMGYGTSYSAGVVALSVGLTTPTVDTDLPQLSTSSSLKTISLYLCTETPGTLVLANSAPGTPAPVGGTLTLSATVAATSVLASGPY